MATVQNQPVMFLPINNSQTEKECIEKLFPKKTMKITAILQLSCGGIAALSLVNTSHPKYRSIYNDDKAWQKQNKNDFISFIVLRLFCWPSIILDIMLSILRLLEMASGVVSFLELQVALDSSQPIGHLMACKFTYIT